ncbi:hypothetical protein CC2G_008625 [Coprinopsis cinerea AmutBmut pab1-1]|nr:hypothetical protein CC2G_008625 [Coprinopsis cinerea AmutBmut pab1-1]
MDDTALSLELLWAGFQPNITACLDLDVPAHIGRRHVAFELGTLIVFTLAPVSSNQQAPAGVAIDILAIAFFLS